MSTKETLRINNGGNAKAYYKWAKMADSQNLFLIEPQEGHVEPNSFSDFTITYSPNQESSGKIDEEKMILRVNFEFRSEMAWI